MLSTPTCKDGRGEPLSQVPEACPGAAGGKARPSPAHPAPRAPASRLQREASARTEVISHLRKPSPTSSPSFRSPQLPTLRGHRGRRREAGGGRCYSATHRAKGTLAQDISVLRSNAAGHRVRATPRLCVRGGWGRSRTRPGDPRLCDLASQARQQIGALLLQSEG